MTPRQDRVHRSPRRAALLVVLVAGCATGESGAKPAIDPGSSDAPREVNIIASDYAFVPPAVDLVPGETVILHVVNGGLTVHEAVIGDQRVQDAWEVAEAAAANPPPGPTPMVSVPPGDSGVRIVVQSGQRIDVTWTVPADAAGTSWFVGCHIPGHQARGMTVPIRFVDAIGRTRRSADRR